MARVEFGAEEWALLHRSCRALPFSRPLPSLRESLALRLDDAAPELARKVRQLDDGQAAELFSRLREGQRPEQERPAAPRTVLVVDDNFHAAEALALFLQLEGFAAATAGNGAEALEYLRANPPPCLIVLDLTMPVMDGWQFRREQLRDPRLAGVPVLLCTAVPPAEGDPVLEGVLGAFAKPVDPERIAEQARRCFAPCRA